MAAAGGKKVGTLHVLPLPERPEAVEMYLEPPSPDG
jgi:hypothetical protein